MCHERWFRRMYEERDADRQLWDEFERTSPPSDPAPTDEEIQIRLERSETDRVASKR